MDWWREPLVHFVVVGVVVLAVGALRDAPEEGEAFDDTIVVSEGIVDDLERQLRTELRQDPTDEELEQAVVSWVDDEVLVREARRLGLDIGDMAVRRRLAEKMALVAAATVISEPTEADLRRLFEQTPEAWRIPAEVTVSMLDAADEAEARSLAERVAGADELSGSTAVSGRTPEGLAEVFGEAFAEEVFALSVGTVAPVRSTLGWHVLRVDSRRDARTLTFDEARDRVLVHWQGQQQERARREAAAQLRGKYRIVR